MKVVSIIIPVYNTEKYISKCIDSVINQTYKEIEIVIINDGSTDKSFEVISSYLEIDKRIKYIEQDNKGVNIARKVGIQESSGEYIFFLDSDDWIEKNTLEILMKIINDNNSQIIRFGYNIEPDLSKGNKTIEKKEYIYDDNNLKEFYKQLAEAKYNSLWGQIIDKKLIDLKNFKSLNDSICFAEDLWFNMELYTKAKKITIISDKLYHYNRANENSTTMRIDLKTVIRNAESAILIYDKLFDFIEKWNINTKKIEREVALIETNVASDEIRKIFYIKNLKKNQRLSIIKKIFENETFERARKVLINDKLEEINIIKRFLIKSIIERQYKKTNKFKHIEMCYKFIKKFNVKKHIKEEI